MPDSVRNWLVAPLLLGLAALDAGADSRLLATGGGTQFEGQAGGGIVPWAVISGYAEDTERGGAVALTGSRVDDFELDIAAVSVGLHNRYELSYARQKLGVEPLGLSIEQDVFGAKLRLAGDLLYGDLPQLSAGLQYKRNRDFAVPASLLADSRDGVDYYLAASRLWLGGLFGRNVLTSLALRSTDANQAGLLGFGAANGSDRKWVAEGSVGVFLNRHWVVGVEYRQKPDLLDTVDEDDWADVFLGWFPNKRVGLVAAFVDLGPVAGLPSQRGWYISVQLNR